MLQYLAASADTLQEIAFRLVNAPLEYFDGYKNLVTLLSLMTSVWTGGWYAGNTVQNTVSTAQTNFDFIVVGGGSAGAAVAARLSENGTYQVLLLEAGGDPTPFNSIPAIAPFNLHLSTDWNYRTEPQINSSFQFEDQRMVWPRGKILGGTSNLNFMVYQRGHPKCFDNWANISGDNSWEYENVLPYFKKFEDYHGNWPDPKFHGTGGPVKIQSKRYQPGAETWVAAGAEMGYPTSDPNAYQVPSFQKMDTFIYDGKRQGTFTAYLEPNLNRTNLHISRNSHVTKINFDDKLRATGVTFVRDGQTLEVTASKEIVLSAGAVGTPQILMLSGIGPAQHLNDSGITPLVDSPGVGQNLQDHVVVQLGPFLLNTSLSFVLERDLDFASFYEYENNGTGPISSNLVSGTAFISTSDADPDWPNIQLHVADIGCRKNAYEDFPVLWGYNKDALKEYLAPYEGVDSHFVIADLARPKSRGSIQLKSNDPFEHPRIDPKYFSHPNDMPAMVEAMQFIMTIFETETYKNVGARYAVPVPQCAHLMYTPRISDEYMECVMRNFTTTLFHPCCTAKFGSDSDPMAVLDSQLRVKGVTGLRVADASVMPEVTNANLNAPTIMIGEKLAELVLNTWRNSSAQVAPVVSTTKPKKLSIFKRIFG